MRLATCTAIAMGLVLAGCSEQKKDGARDDAVPAFDQSLVPTVMAIQTAEPAGQALNKWLVGTWSHDGSCASDFVSVYDADGTMHTDSEAGTWEASGTTVTESITEQFEMGEPDTVRLDPPLVREVEVERIDDTHAIFRYDGYTSRSTKCQA
ncbi:hypothetical protein AAG607_05315 [Citromicrobium bathyomarinum]|jgi:hypothetical protein|uniref:hypothetical protein n=1 Tax=Sphingomonadales TaxID=204457 RepID=UPI001A44450D|nr:hypothetical protein [Citromicrobium sp.]|tara:strand:- start:2055 stop:2510 length:456 start_codon:yes stop_codon:yes gene_type:complete